jgi:hypothetical protein
MKKTMMNFRTVAMALVTVLTIGFTNSTYAAGPGEEGELKFVGHSVNNLPVFQLSLNNSTAAEYTVTVRDGEKRVLLIEKLKGENISRRYKLDVEEVAFAAGTTFEVTNKLTKETTVYAVSSSSKVVENVVVSKI